MNARPALTTAPRDKGAGVMAALSIRRTYKYRLSPTRMQADTLNGQLAEACRLYNAALQERRDAWRMRRQSVTFYGQSEQLKDIRAAGDMGLPNFGTALDVLHRVDRAFDGFFRRVKAGQRVGYPRFQSARRYDSITFPAYGNGCKLRATRLYLQGVGLIRVRLHRPLDGTVKAVTIKREAGRWFVSFSTVTKAQPLPVSTEAIGIDVGLTYFATLSDGTQIANPRYARRAQRHLRLAQQRVTRRGKGSHRRRKAVRLLHRAHIRVQNQRADFHHKTSRAGSSTATGSSLLKI